MTRTDVAREQHDTDLEPYESSDQLAMSGQRDLLLLLTKTLNHRERDDE
jgi:hypothetical protein